MHRNSSGGGTHDSDLEPICSSAVRQTLVAPAGIVKVLERTNESPAAGDSLRRTCRYNSPILICDLRSHAGPEISLMGDRVGALQHVLMRDSDVRGSFDSAVHS